MAERLFVLGAWHGAGSADWPWEVRFRSAGGNTGNLLVGHAASRQLQYAALGALHRGARRVFFDVGQWFDFVRGQDLVIAGRPVGWLHARRCQPAFPAGL